MMLHGVAGRVFVVFVSWAECERVSCLGRFACVSVLPGWTGCGCVALSSHTGSLCVQWKAGATEKRLMLHRMCFILVYCSFVCLAPVGTPLRTCVNLKVHFLKEGKIGLKKVARALLSELLCYLEHLRSSCWELILIGLLLVYLIIYGVRWRSFNRSFWMFFCMLSLEGISPDYCN